MKRRTLIRLLVGLGIGIPILIEAATFLGLVESRLFGDGSDGNGTGTPAARRVAIGDELLPATVQSETLADAVIRGANDPWVLAITVAVENRGEVPYELRLRDVTLTDGRTVTGRSSTGRIATGASGRVTGAWELPAGSTPDRLAVVSVDYAGGTPSATAAEVHLAKIPVRGS